MLRPASPPQSVLAGGHLSFLISTNVLLRAIWVLYHEPGADLFVKTCFCNVVSRQNKLAFIFVCFCDLYPIFYG